MKKLAFILALTFVASSYAQNSCTQSCQKSFDQNSLACFKIMQMCLKSGPRGSEGHDMCQDDFQYCLKVKSDLKEVCLDNCASIDD